MAVTPTRAHPSDTPSSRQVKGLSSSWLVGLLGMVSLLNGTVKVIVQGQCQEENE